MIPTVESFITEKVDTDLGKGFHINEFIESGSRAYVNPVYVTST